MISLNEVSLIGNVGQSPEKKQTKNGKDYVAFSLATNEKWKDAQGNLQESTEWHNLKFYDKLADLVSNYVSKGDKIFCKGKLKTSEYTDKEGIKRKGTEVVCKEVIFLGNKSSKNEEITMDEAIKRMGGKEVPLERDLIGEVPF